MNGCPTYLTFVTATALPAHYDVPGPLITVHHFMHAGH